MRQDGLLELGVVRVATPCSADWEAMHGDCVKRYCAQCGLHVYDFAQLSTNEARALLVETDRRLCGRIFVRRDGTLLTKDCPRGLAAMRRRVIGAWATLATLALGLLTSMLRLVGHAPLAPWGETPTATLAPPLSDATVIRALASQRGTRTMGKLVSVPPVPAFVPAKTKLETSPRVPTFVPAKKT
jgi:hypothetical protein